MTQACYMYSHQYFIWSTHIRVKKIVPHDNVNIVIQAVNKDFLLLFIIFYYIFDKCKNETRFIGSFIQGNSKL